MKRALIIAAALLVPANASAEPIYLSCTLPTKDQPKLDVTIDEATTNVSVMNVVTYEVQLFRGAFTRDLVIFQDANTKYVISRTKQVFIRSTPLLDGVVTGQCALHPPLARSF